MYERPEMENSGGGGLLLKDYLFFITILEGDFPKKSYLHTGVRCKDGCRGDGCGCHERALPTHAAGNMPQ